MPLTVVVPDWLLPYADRPEEILAFCGKHEDILDHLRVALDLVQRDFPSWSKLEVRLEEDSEIQGKWLVIEVTIPDQVDTFLDAYNRCILDWAQLLPPEALSVLCLTYHLT
jgi:hypothetical protein